MALLSRVLFVVAVLLLSPRVRASAPVLVGGLPAPPDSVPSPGLRTHVNLSNPANGDDEVSGATFIWSAAPCASAAKVKFFRRTNSGEFSTLTLLAERGPFDVNFVTETVALSPPVPVHAGDLVGVANLTECGTVTLRSSADEQHRWHFVVEKTTNSGMTFSTSSVIKLARRKSAVPTRRFTIRSSRIVSARAVPAPARNHSPKTTSILP